MNQDAQSTEDVSGWVILSPGAVPDAWRSRAIEMVLVPLTPAEAGELLSGAPLEQQVPVADLPLVRLISRGHSVVEISRALGVSPRTVNRHVARLREEFAVATTQELAAELARRGFS